jgi:hypothetical protein
MNTCVDGGKCTKMICIRFGFVTVTSIYVTVFWDVVLCSLIDKYQYFRGTSWVLLQGRRCVWWRTLVTAPHCMMLRPRWLHSEFEQTVLLVVGGDICIEHFRLERRNFLLVFRWYCKDNTKEVCVLVALWTYIWDVLSLYLNQDINFPKLCSQDLLIPSR